MDTERPGGDATDDASDDAYEPVETSVGTDDWSVAEPAAPPSRLVLGTLAGLGVALVGIAVWALLYQQLEKDFPGVSVVAALLIGYVVREVSRRSDLVPRIVAAVLTAVLCVVGSMVAASAGEAKALQEFAREYPGAAPPSSFTDRLDANLPKTFSRLADQKPLTLVIFGAAVVVAFLSAAPARPKKVKTAPAAADPEPVPEVDPGE